MKQSVDTRFLKDGKVRLRFKVSEEARDIIHAALNLTGSKFQNTALELICAEAHGRYHMPPRINSKGKCRLLIKVYYEQYQNIRSILDEVGKELDSDEDALFAICSGFTALYSHSDKSTFQAAPYASGKALHSNSQCVPL